MVWGLEPRATYGQDNGGELALESARHRQRSAMRPGYLSLVRLRGGSIST
jgi:hypothetical protein